MEPLLILPTKRNELPDELLTKSVLPWSESEKQVAKRLANMMLKSCEAGYRKSPFLPKFAQSRAINLIYNIIKMEKPLPKGTSQHEANKLLASLFSENLKDFNIEPWKVDGDNDQKVASKSQMVQHILAYQHLCSDDSLSKPLTAEIIKETHEILLKGSIDKDGQPVLCGKYRQGPVQAGDNIYPSFEVIEQKMNQIVNEFNNSEDHFILRATKLYYDILTLHPFVNGNGRLSRLLVAYSLMKDGIPFPVSLSNGTKNARENYMQTIQGAGTPEDYSAMIQFILFSLYSALKNYEDTSKLYEENSNVSQ